jgi:hypothetical protein
MARTQEIITTEAAPRRPDAFIDGAYLSTTCLNAETTNTWIR